MSGQVRRHLDIGQVLPDPECAGSTEAAQTAGRKFLIRGEGPVVHHRSISIHIEPGDIDIPLAIPFLIMRHPEIQSIGKPGRGPRGLKQRGIQVAGRLASDKNLLRGRMAADVVNAERKTCGEIRADRPGERQLAPRRIGQHIGKMLVNPGRAIVVALVVRIIIHWQQPSILVEHAIGNELFPRWRGILRDHIRHRKMLIEGGVGKRRIPECIRLCKNVVGRENLDPFPFGRHVRMCSSGMPSVGCDIGIFVRPGDKAEHCDHLLSLRVFHASHEDFPQRPEVGAGRLAGVVHGCLILPDIEIQNRPAIGNEEVEVVDRVVFQRGRLPAFQPESIDIIPEHARVRLARLDEIFQQPDIGVVLCAAG